MSERLLDVTGLPPPEPAERVRAVLATLPAGARLRVLLDREPVLLYPWLAEHGFQWQGQPGPGSAFEILIWRAPPP